MYKRQGESNVRAAGFGYLNFDWNTYMEQQNQDTMVIPMDEDYEFTDHLDEILDEMCIRDSSMAARATMRVSCSFWELYMPGSSAAITTMPPRTPA